MCVLLLRNGILLLKFILPKIVLKMPTAAHLFI